MYKNEHKFPYRWTKKDANFTKDKGKVMSCFCCGGGSSFGYKLAGYDVVACNEIDPKVMKMYLKNHDVKYAFNCDIRELITNINMGGHIMKEELHNLDILDASFPCSVFSIAGDRQKAWGKEKVFREGQKAQRLDDLAFYSIDLAKELKPKVVVFENVQGLLQGEAIEYVKEIYRQMNDAGYILQHWLLNARNMGVPQNRPRVFFIGLRKDLCEPFMVQKDLFERVPKIDIEYKDMQVDHLVPKNRGCYSRWSNKAGKFVVSHGDDSMENYMPSCRSCNLRKRDMSLEQFRSEITKQAKGLLNGKASFQVKMSLAYGLIEEHFDRQIEFYFEKFK